MTDRNKYEQCFLCEEGRMVPSSDLKHKFRYGSREYVVDDLSHATCDRCGTSGFLNGQLTENKNRIKEFQNALIKIMGPSDILSLRAKYSLSQAQAAKIFGGGANAFSKWERGEVIPAESTAKLLRLAFESVEAMEWLAKNAGVELHHDNELNLSNGDKLKGWLWTKLGSVEEQSDAPRFVHIAEISQDCVINDGYCVDENQYATA